MIGRRLPIAVRIALIAGLLAALLLTAGTLAVRAALHATQMRASQQLAAAEAGQITDALLSGIDLHGAFGSLPYQLVRDDGMVVATDPAAEAVKLTAPSTEAPQTLGEVWDVDPADTLGARVAISSTLRASSLSMISPSDLPGGIADKSTTVYRVYVLVTPTAADGVVATLDPFLWGGAALSAALIAATAAISAARALRSVETMRAAADLITGTPDGSRLTEPLARDELRALSQTLNKMLARIDEAATRQQRFTADAAHELRSPSASLIAALDIAQAHPDAVSAAQTLVHVYTEARRLASLTEELLQLASAKRPHPAGEPECDALTVIQECALGLPVHVAIASPETPRVRITATALRRVVGNLVNNAVRHSATGAWVNVCFDGDLVRIDVVDDGYPLSEDDAERIFEPFVRLDASRARDTGGTGLGLTIARELVTQFGGSLTASAAPGPTTFTISLPRAKMLKI